MGNLIRSVIMYVVVIALIVAVLKLLKMHERAVIDPTDHSMETIEYPNGTYKVDSSALKAEDYKAGDGGDVVSYFVPGKPGAQHVARVVALPGEKVAIERTKSTVANAPLVVKVNGKASNLFRPDSMEWHFPEIVVPRGCLFLMADKPSEGEDSLRVGPVPYYCIRGKLPHG
jgi:signal peptidase I